MGEISRVSGVEVGLGGGGVGMVTFDVEVKRGVFPTPLSWLARRIDDLLVVKFLTL